MPTLNPDRLETQLTDKKPLYTDAEARAEAERCLYCADAPCIKACPTEIDIPTFIKKIASGNVLGSARTILEQNLLGHSCARVCPVEVLCAGDCVYTGWGREPIAIGRLQRYATTKAEDASTNLFVKRATSGKKVALVGAGPASLACAGVLALAGVEATIYEKRAVAGGLNTTGIAPYKLFVEDALREVAFVESLGVVVKTGQGIDASDAAALLRDHDAVFLGMGLGEDSKLGIPGEDGPVVDGSGVVGATAWIEQMKLSMRRGQKLGRVVVVGGGNTAIDVARECAQLGAERVTMVYRRGRADMSAYEHELDAGRIEGVNIEEHTQPVEVVRDASGRVTALRVARAEQGKPVAGSEREIPCDFVALAIGQSKLRALAKEFPGVALDARGCVVVDSATGRTGNPKVFAGGDCINGGKEVVNAVADGRNAARTLLREWGLADSTAKTARPDASGAQAGV
jgi:glutamate synthase (NADPH/NADH) small chain